MTGRSIWQVDAAMVESNYAAAEGSTMPDDTCCICGAEIGDADSHSAWPVAADEDRCCSTCNAEVVLPEGEAVARRMSLESN